MWKKLTPFQDAIWLGKHEAVDGFQPDGGANHSSSGVARMGDAFRHLTAAGDYVAYGRR
ncbi:MAG: hypothetical protein R2932_54695 [Caldilineaceae bacterium]